MIKTYISKLKKAIQSTSRLVTSCMVLAAFTGGNAFSQSYTFTPCGATGSLGPTQAFVTSGYASTNLSGNVTVVGSGIQVWTVPTTGAYRIETRGAEGGTSGGTNPGANGGRGAIMIGEFNLTAGQTLSIVVGQKGSGSNYGGSGGGGSYVVASGNTPLCVAGGGGGAIGYPGYANGFYDGFPGLVSTTGGSANVVGGGTYGVQATGSGGGAPGYGGTNGFGGGSGVASGGGGLLGDGANGGTPTNPTYSGGGKSFLNGSAGGIGAQGIVNSGGFGGGGGTQAASGYGAGGGGYSGGGGGSLIFTPVTASGNGGGGGSYNGGINQNNTGGVNLGDGLVIISSLCNIALIGSTTICVGGTANLSTNAVGNYSWSTGSTSQNISLSPLSTTSYTAYGTGTTNNCSATLAFSVIVNPLPVVSVAAQPAVLCVGSQATLTGQGANTYTWTGGPVSTTFAPSPVVNTTYSVSGTSLAGCINSAVATVVVNTLSLTITSNTAICRGKSASLTVGNGTSFNWSNGSPFATINVSPIATTVYTVSGIDANNCVLSTSVLVTVNQSPTVTASSDKPVVCKGTPVTLTAGGASTYTWNPSGSGASITVTPLTDVPTTYSVTGTDDNGCTNRASVTFNVSLCTGINELQSAPDISIYPNPSNGYFTIKSDVAMQLSISNELGQIVKTVYLSETNKNEVSVSELANGIYFITGESNGTKINKKIAVTK